MARKYKRYNNGIKNIIVYEGETVPEGFVAGVLPLSDDKKEEISRRRKETNLKKYGVENPSQSQVVKNKKKEVFLKKYGSTSPFSSKELRDKANKTIKDKYGVDNISQSKVIKDKKVDTCKKNFGVEHPMQSKEVQNKSKETNKKKYGVEHVLQSNDIKEKAKQTTLKRYGVDNASKSQEIKDKIKKTNINKYGTEYPSQSKEVQDKVKKTNLEKYGNEVYIKSQDFKEKAKSTNLKRYGVENPFASEEIKQKIRETNKKNIGVDFPMLSEEVREKSKKTSLEIYGTEYPNQSEEVKEKIEKSTLEHYGVRRPAQSEEIREKIKQTNQERYGVNYAFMLPENRKGHSMDSGPNLKFKKLLDKENILYEREFAIGHFIYDFKVGNNLIEIDPYATHNTLWSPFGPKGIDKEYHKNKSKYARENGFNCIHIFDWDDKQKIISLLKDRETVYARKCEIREVSKEECDIILNENHLQGTCKGQDIIFGLYYNNVLLSIMSFGKPRYNKNYQYELLRYCSTYNIIGGPNKLFKKFLVIYKPSSIISYCDSSKFIGKVYKVLGFSKNENSSISRHWYSPKEKRHITDNLLRQRGYDQLFNESFGKGTSNEELMIKRGYLPIYDCGQDTYIWRCDFEYNTENTKSYRSITE